MGWEQRADALDSAPATSSGWESRADSLPDETPHKIEAARIGLEGPGSKDTDEIKLAPNQPVNAISKSLDNHGDLYIANHPVEAAKGVGNAIVGGVKDLGRSLSNANDQAAQVILHPSTLGDIRFRSEAMRGVNDTVMPYLGNRIVEAIGGPAKDSESDKAAYPNARTFGGVAGMAVPVPVGEAVSLAVKGAKVLAEGAAERTVERAAVGYGERVGKRARTKLEAKEGAPLRNVLADEPELVKKAFAADPERAAAAKTVLEKGRADSKEIYRERDIEAGRKPVAQEIIARAEVKEQEAYAKLQEAKQFPEGTEQNLAAKRDALPILQESQKLRRDAAKKISGSRVHGIRPTDAIPKWDARISELKGGNQSDRDAAKVLEDLRDKFKERYSDPNEIIPTEKLRDEQSDYQLRGYGKAPAGDAALTASIRANMEASKIVGEPIWEHVTGMPYKDAIAMAEANPNSVAGRLLKANEKISVANNILAGLEARKGMAAPKASRIDNLINGIHGASAVVSHGATVPLTIAMKAIPHIPAVVDKGLIGLGKIAEKIPEGPATYNPIGSVVGKAKDIVNKMAEIQAKYPRNTQLGAVDLSDLVNALPKGFMKNRKNLDEAKRLANIAMDKSLPDEKRNGAIRTALDLLKDFGNE